LNCGNGWLRTDVDFVDNLGYARLGETLPKCFEKKYHELSKYIVGKF
jgi:hypothetical protein